MDFIDRVLVHFDPGFGLLREVKYVPRVDHRFLKNIVHRQSSIVHGREQQGKQRLQAREAWRGIFGVFFCSGMRGMVGGEAVDDIHVLPEGIHICLGCQARADFLAAALQPCILFSSKKQMVRTNFTCNFDPFFLRCFDQ